MTGQNLLVPVGQCKNPNAQGAHALPADHPAA